MTTRTDPHGSLNPGWNESKGVRFKVTLREHDPNEEDGWRYKVDVMDLKYLDSDMLAIYSIAAGNSWAEAFKLAGEWIDQALATDHCIF